MSLQDITLTNFFEETSTGLVLVDFWAPWSEPCKMLTSALEELASEMKGAVKVLAVNVEENKELAAIFGVVSVPNILIIKNGEMEESLIGYAPKEELMEIIGEHL